MSHEYPAINGQISANSQAVQTPLSNGSSVVIDIRGTFAGTIQFEVSIDGENWLALTVIQSFGVNTGLLTSANAPGAFMASVSAFSQIRARSSAWTSGVARITIRVSDDPMIMYTIPNGNAVPSTPAGSALIGDVGLQYRTNATGAAKKYCSIALGHRRIQSRFLLLVG